MKSKELEQALKFKWEPWLKRPFHAFVMSVFVGSNSKKAFKKVGLKNWELVSFLFDDGEWYWSEEAYKLAEPEIKKWLKNHKVSEVNDSIDKFYEKNKAKIIELAKKPEEKTKEKLKTIINILISVGTYVWIAHIIEHYLLPIMREKTGKYIKKDIDKFIGDASYPEKKNSLGQMEDEIKEGVNPIILVKKYGWMRARDGFSRSYTVAEIIDHAKTLNKKKKSHQYPTIPSTLKSIYADARELVYLRTKRTDILYEFLFLARPIFKEVAKLNEITFNDLKYYTLQSLAAGKLIKYPKNFGCISYKEKLFFFDKPIFDKNIIDNTHTEVKGAIAQPGLVKGFAKIVLKVSELNKVKKGDILVTHMTSPDFLSAMKISAGFVTNEGGLTCHAAIIAREIKKPCVIGTKIATDVFKDGDLIEVDANEGLVRILKRA